MSLRIPARFIAAVVAGLGIVVLAVVASLSPALASDSDVTAPPGTPTATSYSGTATVGPLFSGSTLSGSHGCTASVLTSPTHDLILTAAHCVTGTAVGWLFVPGYNNGATPYGVWTVTAAFVSPQWTADQDPQHDYAILRVARQNIAGKSTAVQDVTGGNVLGFAPRSGTQITDIAYNAGVGGQAITCSVPVYYTDGYPSFNCHGYVGGSSGSPWIVTFAGRSLHVVVGVIGGLNQGGCYEYTSYSSAFRRDAYRLMLRAAYSAAGDTVPAAGGDGC